MNFLTLQTLSGWGQAAAVGGALAAVGALVAMYFLKLKRTQKLVSSTWLWRKSVEDLRANSPFQRLRRNLLLFLQLVILIAALLALGRPALLPSARGAVSYIVLVDTSASMSAEDVKPSRLAAGIARVRAIVDDMSSTDQMMILTFAAHPSVAATATSDRGELYSALRGIKTGDTSTDVVEALDLAESLSMTLPNPRVVLVSDGAFGDAVSAPTVSAPLEFISVGKGGENLGVTAIDVRRGVDDPTSGEIYARITNFAVGEMSTDVTLLVDGKLADVSRMTVAPTSSKAVIFKVRLDVEKVAEIVIEAEDSLAADNRAWAILEPAKPVRAVLVGPANEFLRTALAAGTGFDVVQVASEVAAPAEGDSTVYVYDGAAPVSLQRAGYLVFDAVPPAEGFKDSGEMKNPVILDVDTSHPITAFLDLGDVYLEKSRKITFPPETKVLVTADEGPLVALSYAGASRIVTVAFDPMDSRWPLRISYPMFVANAVNFLASGGKLASSRHIKAGEVLVLQGHPEATEITVTDPDGDKTRLVCEASGTVAFGGTSRAGIYSVEAGGTRAPYAANLADAGESDIRPTREFRAGSTQVAAASIAAAKNREIWRELLLLAFVVLLVEWYIYNRRVYL